MLLIYRLTKPELDKCREECNFDEDETVYFNARAQHKSHIEIAVTNFWSERKTSEIARHVKDKVKKILKM